MIKTKFGRIRKHLFLNFFVFYSLQRRYIASYSFAKKKEEEKSEKQRKREGFEEQRVVFLEKMEREREREKMCLKIIYFTLL